MAKLLVSIKAIPAEATCAVRHEVLWPDLPLDKQLMPLDALPTTRHYGAFLTSPLSELLSTVSRQQDLKIRLASLDTAYFPQSGHGQLPIGVLTLSEEAFTNREALPTHIQSQKRFEIQLHKFAVKHSMQGSGIGGQMIRQVCTFLPTLYLKDYAEGTEMPHDGAMVLLHFHARKSQKQVYEHWGFAVLSEEVFIKRGPTGTDGGTSCQTDRRIISADSLEDLGLNWKSKDRFKMQYKLHCAPIVTKGHSVAMTDQTGDSWTCYDYGKSTSSQLPSKCNTLIVSENLGSNNTLKTNSFIDYSLA